MNLHGKVAIVTGGGRGIGKAIACMFAKYGCKVYCFDKSTEEVSYHYGLNITLMTVDVGSREEVSDAVNHVELTEGRIDILVNNAASYKTGRVHDMSDMDWDASIAGTLGPVFNVAKSVLPAMIKARSGNIINVSSVNQIHANPNLAAYTAAKGAITALTKQMAVEYSNWSIRVNSIAPALIVTDLTKPGRSEEDWAIDAAAYPIGRVGTVDDVAFTALFLACDESSFITGIEIPVDGGLTAVSPSAMVSPKIRDWWGKSVLGSR